MRITDPFLLPDDLIVQPVSSLEAEVRSSLGADPADMLVSRRNSRALSKVLDPDAAALLREFNAATTIALAIARFSRARALDPEKLLEQALPMLRSLIRDQFLLPADMETVDSPLPIGKHVGPWEVTLCIQSLDDSETYQVRANGAWGALKICRHGDSLAAGDILHEADVLRAMSLEQLPRLLDSGAYAGRPFLVTEWFRGSSVQNVAGELRQQGSAGLADLWLLCAEILDAYASLHEAGVLHGDIHGGNILVDSRNRLRLLDFGLAHRSGTAPRIRAGVSYYYEPEFALAALEGRPTPVITAPGEQYAVAALLYLLLTGAHTQHFSLERTAMLEQIATRPALPFAQRGRPAWPDAEQILSRALAKTPAERFSSLRAMSDAWRNLTPPDAVSPPPDTSRLADLRRRVLQHSAWSSPDTAALWRYSGFTSSPSASVNFGAAGLAYALFRFACVADDAALFARADTWSQYALHEMTSASGLYP